MFIFFNLSQEWFDIITIIIIIIIKKSVQNWLYPRIWNILHKYLSLITRQTQVIYHEWIHVKQKRKKKQEYEN